MSRNNMNTRKLTREQMASVVARDIAPDSYVNLGIGMPTLVADYLESGKGHHLA